MVEGTDRSTFFDDPGFDDSSGELGGSVARLEECWQSALGFGPSSPGDTLRDHRVSKRERNNLLWAIRSAFNCDLDSGLFPFDMPFSKTAHLLRPLVVGEKKPDSGPNIWLAPGLGGVGLGELLMANAYRAPGRIQLLRYPRLRRMADVEDAIEAHVSAVMEQLPVTSGTDGLVLAGFSLGAHVMFEVACRLLAVGRPVALLVLIHSVAFPRRSDLHGFDYRLSECRRPYEFRRWMEWTLASEHPGSMRLNSRLLAALASLGWRESAFWIDGALSCAIRLKAFSYSVRHSRYPGQVALLRPSGDGTHPDKDAGWGSFCNEIQICEVPVAAREFLAGQNRATVTQELARLIDSSLPLPAS